MGQNRMALMGMPLTDDTLKALHRASRQGQEREDAITLRIAIPKTGCCSGAPRAGCLCKRPG
jgi:hypothetical protein